MSISTVFSATNSASVISSSATSTEGPLSSRLYDGTKGGDYYTCELSEVTDDGRLSTFGRTGLLAAAALAALVGASVYLNRRPCSALSPPKCRLGASFRPPPCI